MSVSCQPPRGPRPGLIAHKESVHVPGRYRSPAPRRARRQRPARRDPVAGAVDVDAVVPGCQWQVGHERRGAAARTVVVPLRGAPGAGAGAGAAHARNRHPAQQKAPRTDPARRLDVPGHADVLHHAQLHSPGRGHRHQFPGALAGAVAGAVDPEGAGAHVALRGRGHRLRRRHHRHPPGRRPASGRHHFRPADGLLLRGPVHRHAPRRGRRSVHLADLERRRGHRLSDAGPALHPAPGAAGAAGADAAGLDPADLHRRHGRPGPPVPDRGLPPRAGLDPGALHLPADHQRHHGRLAGVGPLPGSPDLARHRHHLRQRHRHRAGGMAARPRPTRAERGDRGQRDARAPSPGAPPRSRTIRSGPASGAGHRPGIPRTRSS